MPSQKVPVLPVPTTYSLQDLAAEAETEVRTIRYYISIDLLPPPISRGRDARYDLVHRQRLEWIKILRKQFKLDEIRQFFQEYSEEKILEMVQDAQELRKNPVASYLDSIAGAFQPPVSSSRPNPASGKSRPLKRLSGSKQEDLAPLEQLLHKLAPEKGARHIPSRSSQRWEIIEIVPGIELHVRDPSRSLQSRLERACDYIRHLLKGGSHG